MITVDAVPVVYPFLNPLTDFGFKHLFGTDANKDLLISFLNALFKGEKKIVDVTYRPTEHTGDEEAFKKVYFDIACTTDHGEHLIIEMQREKQQHFRDRCIFYLSRSIQKQIAAGGRWKEPLAGVYVIALMDFKLADSEAGSYLQDIALMNKDTAKVFYIKLGFKFIELPCFNKTEAELETDLDKWLYILKNMGKLTQVPASLRKGVYFKFFQEAELIKMSKIEREIYDSNWKSYNDYLNTIDFAEMKGRKKGMAKGILKGKVEGKAEGIAEERRKNGIITAKKLKKELVSMEIISKVTGLPIPEIEKLP